MEMDHLVSIINDVFEREGHPINLNSREYEMGVVKKLPKADLCRWKGSDVRRLPDEASPGILNAAYNVVDRNDREVRNTNGQTHFTFNRDSERIFSGIEFDRILQEYTLCYPCHLYEENLKVLLNHLPERYYTDSRKNYLLEKYNVTNRKYKIDLSIRLEAQTRVMVANKTSILSSEISEEDKNFFLENRYMLFKEDLIVILKLKKQMKYLMLFLPFPALNDDDLEKIGDRAIEYTQNNIEQQFYSVEHLHAQGATNTLIFGAPGTGKSYYVDEKFGNKLHRRVVFHEEYSNQDFVGAIKPKISEGRPVYKFDPGPFTLILKEALLDKQSMYTLIIEEMNRANAASVFGDIFQLLDRNPEGVSEYSIYNEAIQIYLKESGIEVNTIKLPSNLNIVATMNSADQGVFPLDTAFKRRWNYEYMPIQFDEFHENTNIDYVIEDDQGNTVKRYISVEDYLKTINDYLSNNEFLDTNEDRLIGPYYLKPSEWESWKEEKSYRKLLAYLWDDVARLERKVLFKGEISQFSMVCELIENDNQVYSDELHTLLKDKSKIETIISHTDEG